MSPKMLLEECASVWIKTGQNCLLNKFFIYLMHLATDYNIIIPLIIIPKDVLKVSFLKT